MRLDSWSLYTPVAVFAVFSTLLACSPDERADVGSNNSTIWSVDSIPVAIVGLDESVEAEIFGSVTSAQLLRGGGFVVLDAQSREIRAFSEAGAHLWTGGGSGNGPSEFIGAFDIGVRPDSTIDVTDLSNWKIVRFAPDGTFLESLPIRVNAGVRVGGPRVPMTDGTIPLMGGEERMMPPTSNMTFATAELIVSLVRDGSAQEVFRSPGGQGFQKVENGQRRGGLVPFGRVMAWDSGRDVVTVGNGHAPPTVIDASGDARQIPSPFPRLAVSESLKAEFLTTREEDRDLYSEVLRSPVVPDSTASYDVLRVDSFDRVWVRQYQAAPQVHRWAIVDLDGGILGRVRLPRDARFLDASESQVLIARETGIGVPYVELRRLQDVDAQAPSI